MNTIILKIFCWINGIKNPFVWAYEQEIKEHKKKKIEHILAYGHGYKDGQIEILEKIRADIEDFCKKSNITFDSNISACLDIIDKYRKGEAE